jgi:gliding motility-associated-like protein
MKTKKKSGFTAIFSFYWSDFCLQHVIIMAGIADLFTKYMGNREAKPRFLLLSYWILLLAFSLAGKQARATHIVGADLYYECLGGDNYHVTLKFMRDCSPGSYVFDDPIYLYVLQANNPNAMLWFSIPLPSDTVDIEAEGWDICVGNTNDPCIREATFDRNIQLPAITGGYIIGWARCCRNDLITNLLNPLDEGATWIARIPGPELAVCNNMPVFGERPPVYMCADREFSMDHSAIDPDGDSLSYLLTSPWSGLNFQGVGAGSGLNPGPIIDPGNQLGPPPYLGVVYASPLFNGQNPFGPNSANIDAQTGWLTFNPPNIGVYVVAIVVREYRNGILLSENKRDFQVHVVNCLQPDPPPEITHDLTGLTTNGDTILVQASEPFCYDVIVTDSNTFDVLHAQAISSVFSANPFPPSPTINITGNNPLNVQICWEPACDYVGQTVALIITGWDDEDCPHYNHVFDTVWVRILPAPNVGPQVQHSFAPGSTFNGDTLFLEVDSADCFEWWVTDTISTGNLAYSYTLEQLSGGGSLSPTVTVTALFPDSIRLSACFTAACGDIGRLYRMVMTGANESGCPPSNQKQDTVYIFVEPVPNPPPVVNHNLSGTVFSNDTIYTEVHDTFCYTFSVIDTFPSQSVAYSFAITQAGGGAAGGPAPVVTVLAQNDSLLVQVCWGPNCENVGGTFLLAVTGTQNNKCNQFASATDSVWVIVSPENNPPPIISHSFLPGYTLSGDTIILTPDSAACFDFSLRDTVYRSHLTILSHVELVSTGASTGQPVQVTYSTVLDTLIEGTLCFTPGCEYDGALLRIVMEGIDTFDCDIANHVFDTIWVRVIEPTNNPPTINHDLTGLNVQGDVVQVIPNGQNFCYSITLQDPDSVWASLIAEGVSEIFENTFSHGNAAEVTTSGTNPLLLTVCWNPSCHDTLKDFDLVVCGRDTSRCGLTPQVCDTVRFHVGNCSFEVQNVFSPNGDGNNDLFLPFNQQGVEYWHMQIYDRWGVKVTDVFNQSWNGTYGNSNPVPEGVFYYVVKYQMWSAKGAPIDAELVGWVALLR